MPAHISEGEWSQIASKHGLDPKTGAKPGFSDYMNEDNGTSMIAESSFPQMNKLFEQYEDEALKAGEDRIAYDEEEKAKIGRKGQNRVGPSLDIKPITDALDSVDEKLRLQGIFLKSSLDEQTKTNKLLENIINKGGGGGGFGGGGIVNSAKDVVPLITTILPELVAGAILIAGGAAVAYAYNSPIAINPNEKQKRDIKDRNASLGYDEQGDRLDDNSWISNKTGGIIGAAKRWYQDNVTDTFAQRAADSNLRGAQENVHTAQENVTSTQKSIDEENAKYQENFKKQTQDKEIDETQKKIQLLKDKNDADGKNNDLINKQQQRLAILLEEQAALVKEGNDLLKDQNERKAKAEAELSVAQEKSDAASELQRQSNKLNVLDTEKTKVSPVGEGGNISPPIATSTTPNPGQGGLPNNTGTFDPRGGTKITGISPTGYSGASVTPHTSSKGLAKNQQTAYDTLVLEGMSPSSAKIAVANISGESLANPSDYHFDPSGGGQMAAGIVQWDTERSTRIEKQFGKLPQNMSLEEQTKAYAWEMKTYYPKAWADLNNEKLSEQERMHSVVKGYENPAKPEQDTNYRLGLLHGMRVKEGGSNKLAPEHDPDVHSAIKGGIGLSKEDIAKRIQQVRPDLGTGECVDLAMRFGADVPKHVSEWRRGQAGINAPSGTPLSLFESKEGKETERYDAGGGGTYRRNTLNQMGTSHAIIKGPPIDPEHPEKGFYGEEQWVGVSPHWAKFTPGDPNHEHDSNAYEMINNAQGRPTGLPSNYKASNFKSNNDEGIGDGSITPSNPPSAQHDHPSTHRNHHHRTYHSRHRGRTTHHLNMVRASTHKEAMQLPGAVSPSAIGASIENEGTWNNPSAEPMNLSGAVPPSPVGTSYDPHGTWNNPNTENVHISNLQNISKQDELHKRSQHTTTNNITQKSHGHVDDSHRYKSGRSDKTIGRTAPPASRLKELFSSRASWSSFQDHI